MTLRTKLMTSAGALLLSSGLAAAAPAVVASSVNLRTGPGTQYDVIGAMPSGATVDVLGCGPAWCRVAFNGTLGFASRGYLNVGVAAVGPGYPGEGAAVGPVYPGEGYAVPPDYRPVGEGYVTTGYGADDFGTPISPGYGDTAYGGYRGEREEETTVRGPRVGEETQGANVRGAERPGNQYMRANTQSPGARVGANANRKTRETTGAGSRSGNRENRRPNSVGAGPQY